ncbi:unnamed protein product [Durusdinium trenchii]
MLRPCSANINSTVTASQGGSPSVARPAHFVGRMPVDVTWTNVSHRSVLHRLLRFSERTDSFAGGCLGASILALGPGLCRPCDRKKERGTVPQRPGGSLKGRSGGHSPTRRPNLPKWTPDAEKRVAPEALVFVRGETALCVPPESGAIPSWKVSTNQGIWD